MDISHLFNKTIDIYKPTQSKDSVFSSKNSYYLSSSDVSCRVQKNRGLEPTIGGRKFSQKSYYIYLPYNSDVKMEDLIRYKNENYNIIRLKKERNKKLYVRITCEISDIELSDIELPEYGTYTLKEAAGSFSAFSDFAVYNDNLVLGTTYFGNLYKWTGTYRADDSSSAQLTKINITAGPTLADNAKKGQTKLVVFNDELYAAGIYRGQLWKYSEALGDLEVVANITDPAPINTTQITDIIEHDSIIYGVSTLGYLYSWSGSGDWVKETATGKVNDIVVYNETIYGINSYITTDPSTIGTLYKWTGTDWEKIADAPSTNSYFNSVNFRDYTASSTGDLTSNNYYTSIVCSQNSIYCIFTDTTPTSYIYFYDFNFSSWTLIDSIADRVFWGLTEIDGLLYIGATDNSDRSYLYGLVNNKLKDLVTLDKIGTGETFTIATKFNDKIFVNIVDLSDNIDSGYIYELVKE